MITFISIALAVLIALMLFYATYNIRLLDHEIFNLRKQYEGTALEDPLTFRQINRLIARVDRAVLGQNLTAGALILSLVAIGTSFLGKPFSVLTLIVMSVSLLILLWVVFGFALEGKDMSWRTKINISYLPRTSARMERRDSGRRISEYEKPEPKKKKKNKEGKDNQPNTQGEQSSQPQEVRERKEQQGNNRKPQQTNQKQQEESRPNQQERGNQQSNNQERQSARQQNLQARQQNNNRRNNASVEEGSATNTQQAQSQTSVNEGEGTNNRAQRQPNRREEGQPRQASQPRRQPNHQEGSFNLREVEPAPSVATQTADASVVVTVSEATPTADQVKRTSAPEIGANESPTPRPTQTEHRTDKGTTASEPQQKSAPEQGVAPTRAERPARASYGSEPEAQPTPQPAPSEPRAERVSVLSEPQRATDQGQPSVSEHEQVKSSAQPRSQEVSQTEPQQPQQIRPRENAERVLSLLSGLGASDHAPAEERSETSRSQQVKHRAEGQASRREPVPTDVFVNIDYKGEALAEVEGEHHQSHKKVIVPPVVHPHLDEIISGAPSPAVEGLLHPKTEGVAPRGGESHSPEQRAQQGHRSDNRRFNRRRRGGSRPSGIAKSQPAPEA